MGHWPPAHIGQPAIARVLSAPAGAPAMWDMGCPVACIGQGHLCAAELSDGAAIAIPAIGMPAIACGAPPCIMGHPAAIGIGAADWEAG